DRVPVGDAVVVDDEGGHPVALEVLARLALQGALRPGAVGPVAIVHLLEEVRHPAGGAEAAERRVALARDAADLLLLLALVPEADVHADGDADLLGLGPEGITV